MIYLGFHVHQMKTFGVYSYINPNDLVGTRAGLGEDLASEKGCSVGRNVPAVLKKKALQMVHLFTHSFTGA